MGKCGRYAGSATTSVQAGLPVGRPTWQCSAAVRGWIAFLFSRGTSMQANMLGGICSVSR